MKHGRREAEPCGRACCGLQRSTSLLLRGTGLPLACADIWKRLTEMTRNEKAMSHMLDEASVANRDQGDNGGVAGTGQEAVVHTIYLCNELFSMRVLALLERVP